MELHELLKTIELWADKPMLKPQTRDGLSPSQARELLNTYHESELSCHASAGPAPVALPNCRDNQQLQEQKQLSID